MESKKSPITIGETDMNQHKGPVESIVIPAYRQAGRHQEGSP